MHIDYRSKQLETCKYSDLEVGDVFYYINSPCNDVKSNTFYMKVEIDPDYLDTECTGENNKMFNPAVLLTPLANYKPGTVVNLTDVYNDSDSNKMVKVDTSLTVFI